MEADPERNRDGDRVSTPTPAPLRYWNVGVDGLAALGTLMIVALMGMIVADVLARNVIGGSLPLISELGALTLVMIVFLQLGTTVRNQRMARTDFFLAELTLRRPRIAAFLQGLFDIAGVAVCLAIAWSTWIILGRDMAHRQFIGVTGALTVPTWPFRALILLGITVAALQFAVSAAASFRAAFGQEKPA